MVDTQLQREDRDGAVRPGGFAPVLVAVGDASISAVPGMKRVLAQPRINSAAVQNDIEFALYMSTDVYLYIYYKSSIF